MNNHIWYVVRKNKRRKIQVAVDIIIISPLLASFLRSKWAQTTVQCNEAKIEFTKSQYVGIWNRKEFLKHHIGIKIC